jgi:hypothetical protein
MGGPIDYGPPPGPMMSYNAPSSSQGPPGMYTAPPATTSHYHQSTTGVSPPQVHQQPVWQPPHPDGFASGPSSQHHHNNPQQKSSSSYSNVPQPPNQYSAFNPGSGSLSRPQNRYVAYGQTSNPPTTTTTVNPSPAYGSIPAASPYSASPSMVSSYGGNLPLNQPPVMVAAMASAPGVQSNISSSYGSQYGESPRSPGNGEDNLEEISLSSNSSSVM